MLQFSQFASLICSVAFVDVVDNFNNLVSMPGVNCLLRMIHLFVKISHRLLPLQGLVHQVLGSVDAERYLVFFMYFVVSLSVSMHLVLHICWVV